MQLYVGRLSDDTNEVDIKELFSRVCPVQSVRVIRDIESGKSRGFAIVEILSQDNGEDAIRQFHGSVLRRAKIAVRKMPETLPGEMEFREWLTEHASDVLSRVGVREGQAVLDYGCGSGTFTIPSARIVGKEGRVYALEVRPKMLEALKEKAESEGLTNVVTLLLDHSKLNTGLPDDIVDAVLVYDVMHEIEDKVGLLRELHRVARRGCILSIFPMHMGTDRMLHFMKERNLFCFRDRYSPLGYKAASEILNFNKC
jgi:SAM-dependent methyltransferase